MSVAHDTPVRPRVTALMPTWNGTAFIEPVLRSLANQTYPNLDVLISDDASSDETATLCERFADRHPRFVVHRQVANRGWIGNANWLLAHGDGEYLFFAFHDDPLEPSYVERLVDALEAAPDAVLAFTDITVERETPAGPRVTRARYEALDGLVTAEARLRVLREMEGYWWIPNRGLFRRAAAARTRGLRRHLAGEYAADWPWVLHLALLGPFVRVPEPLLRKHLRLGGVSGSWRHNARTRLAVVLSAAREIGRADLPLVRRGRLLAGFAAHWTRRFATKLLINPFGRQEDGASR